MKRSELNLLPWTKFKSLGNRVDSLRDFHRLQGYAPLRGRSDAGGHLKAAQDGRFVQAQLYRDIFHYQTRIEHEIRLTPILTFDLEGNMDAENSHGLPDGVILAPMGGLTVYYHVPSILKDPELSGPDHRAKFAKAFAFLGEFLRDPSVIKIGSDIHKDAAKLAELLDLPKNCPHVFDTLPIVERLRDGIRHNFDPVDPSSRLYSSNMIKVMGGRTGLDVLAQLHAGFSYKCYSMTGYNRAFAGNRFDYDREIEWFRKIRHASEGEAASPMFKWSNNPLEPYQTIYVYNDVAIVHTVILDAVQLAVQSPDWLVSNGEKLVTEYSDFVTILAFLFRQVYPTNFDHEQFLKGAAKIPSAFERQSAPSVSPIEPAATEKASTVSSGPVMLCSIDIGNGDMEIYDHHYQTVLGERHVCGEVIDFYISYLVQRSPYHDQIHYFPTEFLVRLFQLDQDKPVEDRYAKIRRRTRRIDLFSKAMVIIPVHQRGKDDDADHWYVIICTNLQGFSGTGPSPNLLVLDSLGRLHKTDVAALRAYFFLEYEDKKGRASSLTRADFRTRYTLTPRQRNSFDCGIYVMHSVELVIEQFGDFLGQNLPDLATWFTQRDITQKRTDLARFIIRTSEEESKRRQAADTESSLSISVRSDLKRRSYRDRTPVDSVISSASKQPRRSLDEPSEKITSPIECPVASSVLSSHDLRRTRLAHTSEPPRRTTKPDECSSASLAPPCPNITDHRMTRPALLYSPSQLELIEKSILRRRDLFGDYDAAPKAGIEATLSPDSSGFDHDFVSSADPTFHITVGLSSQLPIPNAVKRDTRNNKISHDVEERLRVERLKSYQRERKRQEGSVREEMLNGVPPFLSANTALRVLRRCRDCGHSKHAHGVRECPVLSVHSRFNVFETKIPPSFFCFWPCPYCGSSRHALPICPHLHAYCQTCNSRGHVQTPECESPLARSHEQKFEVFKNFGVLTRYMSDLFSFRQPNVGRSNWMEVSERCFRDNAKIRGENIYLA